MALIEVFHVVASNLPIDTAGATDIPQGLLLNLNTIAQVEPANGDSDTLVPIGIAGDSRSQGTTAYTPDSGSALSRNPTVSLEGALVVGAYGASQRYTQPHVADGYNETLASGKMTVYHSGGEFWTDQYEVVQSNGTTLAAYTPGTLLYASGTETKGANALEPDAARTGRFTDEAATANTNWACVPAVGVTLTAPTAYPSGVPGTDVGFTALPEGGNSLSWGNFLHVKLLV